MSILSESEITNKWAETTGKTPKKVGKQWLGYCPIHEADGEPHHPSCNMRFESGKPLWTCRSGGCNSAAIQAKVMGYTDRYTPPHVTQTAEKTYASVDEAIAALPLTKEYGKPHQKWSYYDAESQHVGEVLRWKHPDGRKDIRPLARQCGGRWAVKAMPKPRPLYHLVELPAEPADKPVYIVEGEPCADALTRLGLLAATSSGGANAAKESDWEPLAGRRVFLIPDKDEPGRQYTDRVAAILRGLPKPPASVSLIDLPGLDKGEDIVQWLERRPDSESVECTIGALNGLAEPYPPDAAAPVADGDEAEGADGAILPQPCDVADIADDATSELRPVVIEGYLRAGETANLNAPPKTGKSWLTYGLAISVALGRKWMEEFECTPGKVLILDNELHDQTIKHRIKKVCDAMGIDRNSLRGKLQYECFRGRLVRFDALERYMEALASKGYSLIVCDAYYRFFSGDENSNSETASAYNLIDRFTNITGAAIVLVHHQTKGNQSDKSVVDTGAGAGSQSRAADSHIVLREHEEAGRVVMEGRCRTWKTPEPMTLRYEYPLWLAEPHIEPVLKTLRVKKKATDNKDDKPAEPRHMAVVKHALAFPKPLAWFTGKTGLNQTTCRLYLAEAVELGDIHLWRGGKNPNESSRWATVEKKLF